MRVCNGLLTVQTTVVDADYAAARYLKYNLYLLLSRQAYYRMGMKLLALVLVTAGCASNRGLRLPGPTGMVGTEGYAYVPPEMEEVEHLEPVSTGTRRGRRVAKAAEGFLGKKRMTVHGKKYRYDCSGMVCAAHVKAGLNLSGNTRSMYEYAKDVGVFHKRKRPDVGDVAFFDNTWDRNKNGRRDDRLTHIAIVEKVERDGTITLIHLGNSGINRLVMNLKHPGHRTSAQGKPWNSVLRNQKKGKRLTGELFSGFGSIWSVSDRQIASR